LDWLEGESGPDGWAKVIDLDGLASMARLLRRMHDASVGFSLSPEMSWADESAPTTDEVICHGDFGPWNLVWSGLKPVGIIDWDLAHAGRRLDDLAYALEYVAPFRDDREAIRWLRYPEAPDRAMRIRRFCVAYGWGGEPDRVDPPSSTQMVELVDAVIDRQIRARDLAGRLAAEGIEPQATWVAEGRSAIWNDRIGWSQRNRTALVGG
jgi:aminoglycoside phosphotransferase (APT) family kinase protein